MTYLKTKSVKAIRWASLNFYMKYLKIFRQSWKQNLLWIMVWFAAGWQARRKSVPKYLLLCKTKQSGKTGENYTPKYCPLNGWLRQSTSGYLYLIYPWFFNFWGQKAELTSLYKPANLRLLFLLKLISFGMERPFIKRDTKNQKLIAGGSSHQWYWIILWIVKSQDHAAIL